MRFNSIEKDHLRLPKKVIFKDGIDWSFILSKIVMNYESHWLEPGGTAGFCGQRKSVGEITTLMGLLKRLKGPLSYGRGPAMSLSCFLASSTGVLAQGNLWLQDTSELMFGFAQCQDWVSQDPLEVLCDGCQTGGGFLYNPLWGKVHPLVPPCGSHSCIWLYNQTQQFNI